MITEDKVDYRSYLERAAKYVEGKGYENIKVDMEGYELPKSYLRKSQNDHITPDIVAERNGQKYIFDLSLKSHKPNLLKSKWLFLKTLSQIKNFNFRIITTRGHLAFTERMTKDLQLRKHALIKM
jgi:hypothetical protein